ncbi:MAG TPA: M1 family aminopeptidase [Thermoplasmata archaeon]|nr:M1 family aminopeptidase [Thermoplasmata archaeon]
MTELIETCRGQRLGAFADRMFAPTETSEQWARERTFLVQHLRLDVTVDDEARTVSGTATHRLVPINDGLKEVVLDQDSLDIRGVKDADGKALEFEAVGQQLIIHLPRVRKAGDPFEVRVRYAASPKKGLFFTGPDKGYPKKPRIVWTQGEEMDNRAWYPSYDYPNQKFTTEIVVTVRDRYRAIANGRLVSEKHDEKKGTRTFHWLQDKPHPNYLVALVVGEWDTKEWDADGVPVQAYVPKGMGKAIDLCFSRVPEMVKFFGRVTGLKYPWDKYAQACVPDFTFGGMENTSLTILHEYCLTDEHAYPDYSSDGLLSHELAHQWFGDWLTCKSWGHLWLNESFADYFECLWWEDHYGKDDFLVHLEETREGYYEEAEKEYKRAIVTHKFVDAEDMLDGHTYNKGCGVLHMLRTVLGDDLWWKGIRNYVAQHGRQNVETTDFRVALEEATGKSLAWFFEEWLLKPGHPEFEVAWSYDEAAKQVEVKVKQTQETKDGVPIFQMPIEIEFATDDRVWRETVQIDKTENLFRIGSPRRPKSVVFDPDGALLKKLTFKKEKAELLWQLAHAHGVWARMEACEGLGRFVGDGEAVAALEKALTKDKFWGVRRAAALGLGEVGTEAARDVLLGSLKGQDSRVRRGIYRALGKFRKDDVAFKALSQAYLEDGIYLPMATAALAMAETRHDGAFDAIVNGMDRPSQAEWISRSASNAIADLRLEKGIQALVARTAYGQPELRRFGAGSALGKLGYYHERRRDEILEELAALARDSNYRTKLGAVEGMAALGYKKAIGELEKIQDTSVLGNLRRNARQAASAIKEKHAENAKRLEQQDELDKLKDENKELKIRVTGLEAKMDAMAKRRR